MTNQVVRGVFFLELGTVAFVTIKGLFRTFFGRS